MWSNVYEQISDGAAGFAPKEQPPLIFAGPSSRGAVDTPLALGAQSKTEEIIGYGPLPEAIRDCQKDMADCSIIAVRTEADIPGEAFGEWASGDFGELMISGAPAYACRIELEDAGGDEVIIKEDSGAVFRKAVDAEGRVGLTELGLQVQLPLNRKKSGRWGFETSAPKSSPEALKRGIVRALEAYTPEAVAVCQESGAKDAAFWGAEAERYFEAEHKPVLILLASSPDASLPYPEAVSAKIEEFSKIDARFVSVLCQPGHVVDGSFRRRRAPLGLLAGVITKSKVSQSIGATRYFAVKGFEPPAGWANTDSRALDEARFVTLRTYAGLNGLFWSNGRTMAGDESDYRYIEVVRTVHKALRLARRACLPRIQAPADQGGVKEILALIRSALNGMTGALELLDFDLAVPSGQNMVDEGLLVNISLFGVPVVRRIVLNFSYRFKQED